MPCLTRRMAAIPDVVERCRPGAEALVRDLWPRIERMALELLEGRGALGADEARKLSQRAEWCR